jgi:hypothetical protein
MCYNYYSKRPSIESVIMSTSIPKELISAVPSNTDMFPFIVVAKSDTTDLVCVIAAKTLESANKLIAFEDMDELFGFEEEPTIETPVLEDKAAKVREWRKEEAEHDNI